MFLTLWCWGLAGLRDGPSQGERIPRDESHLLGSRLSDASWPRGLKLRSHKYLLSGTWPHRSGSASCRPNDGPQPPSLSHFPPERTPWTLVWLEFRNIPPITEGPWALGFFQVLKMNLNQNDYVIHVGGCSLWDPISHFLKENPRVLLASGCWY